MGEGAAAEGKKSQICRTLVANAVCGASSAAVNTGPLDGFGGELDQGPPIP